MLKPLILSVALVTGGLALSTQSMAQGAPQSIMPYSVDIHSVQSGYRASKLIGAEIVNDTNDKIGTVDDLIVTTQSRVPYAIVSVGGFLGIGDKLVAIPYSVLKFRTDNKIELPGGSKDTLKSLPAFTYNK